MALEGRQYICHVCGQVVKVTKEGQGILVCCGEEMELIPLEE
jgi:desulfoferrodoxin-like iron-binding protein